MQLEEVMHHVEIALNKNIAKLNVIITSLRAEMDSEETKRMGEAAVACVRESLEKHENDVARLVQEKSFKGYAITREELELLYNCAERGMWQSKLAFAYGCVEALLCQAKRGNVCPDMLTHPMNSPLGGKFEKYILQGLCDRVESLNVQVAHR